MKLHNGKVKVLTNVKYVPSLKQNLKSIGTLDELGFSYTTYTGKMHISRNNDIILSKTKKNELYVLDERCA